MIVGIDLGTTNSLVAVWRDARAELIPNALGELLTPSCVSLDQDGSVLVGRAARERLQSHPQFSAGHFKRYMGSNKTLRLGNREFRPEELAALVLKSLKADAEAQLGEPVDEAVITVPAYFSDAQRKATRAAGQLAGLRVERLLNEPSAAALAYGIHEADDDSRFLVFDLGGGTFDVSILELFEGVMEVRATAGDNLLGGEDFTELIAAHLLEHGNIPGRLHADPQFRQALRAQAERAKRALGSAARVDIELVHDEQLYPFSLDEAALEQITKPLLARLRAPVERALRDARLRSAELDRVVLAGGATRMPLVRKLVTMMFGRFPSTELNPDEIVARGAAVQAGLKARDAALQEMVMTDVSPYSLGVAVSKRLGAQTISTGHFDPIIERNMPVPVSRVSRYFPIHDAQRELIMEIYQGEARMVTDNIRLGTLQFELPGGQIADSAVDVRFTYDVNGLLQVEATVLKTGRSHSVIIEGNPGLLSAGEIQDRLQALAQLKQHPRERLDVRTLLARAERLYMQLRGEVREWLANEILRFETALQTQDEREIRPAQRHFEALLAEIDRDAYLQPDDLPPA